MLEQMTLWDFGSATSSQGSEDGAKPCDLQELEQTKEFGLGSCPCQAFSTAGKQKGFKDKRDLWPAFFELIKTCQPERVFGEQVGNAIRHGLARSSIRRLGRRKLHRRGRSYWEHTPSGHRIKDKDCTGVLKGFPTATVNDASGSQYQMSGKTKCMKLPGIVQVCAYPTPQTMDTMNVIREPGERSEAANKGGCSNLREVVHVTAWPTPSAMPRGAHKGREIKDGQTISLTTGTAFGMTIETAAQQAVTTWMSPKASDCKNPGVSQHVHLKHQAETTVTPWATTSARDWKDTPGNGGDRDESGWDNKNEIRPASEASLSNNHWSDYQLIYCRDEKIRRIPSQSVLFGMADGVSDGVDKSRDCSLSTVGGFPLCQKEDFGRGEISMLLKGIGNAIVPEVAAEFLKAWGNEINNNQDKDVNNE